MQEHFRLDTGLLDDGALGPSGISSGWLGMVV